MVSALRRMIEESFTDVQCWERRRRKRRRRRRGGFGRGTPRRSTRRGGEEETSQGPLRHNVSPQATLGSHARSAGDPSLPRTRVWRRAIRFFLIRIRFCRSQSPSWLLPLARYWLVSHNDDSEATVNSQLRTVIWTRPIDLLCWREWQQLPQTNVQSTIQLGLAIARLAVCSTWWLSWWVKKWYFQLQKITDLGRKNKYFGHNSLLHYRNTWKTKSMNSLFLHLRIKQFRIRMLTPDISIHL